MQWVKLLLIELAALLPIQLPSNLPGNAEEDSTSTLASATYMGELDGVLSSWLWTWSSLGIGE